ncbi:hypothetical protein PR048_023301 [Dryococelus australis]|uniref:Reverse transcriptase domain-containing protein n=1 Tax=Dryococelus australis TaxID=614101 RepID=A0ABQ9GTS3_9NEOP|nr:hypothetical protein PR048_023301 [Dryococelus australis]
MTYDILTVLAKRDEYPVAKVCWATAGPTFGSTVGPTHGLPRDSDVVLVSLWSSDQVWEFQLGQFLVKWEPEMDYVVMNDQKYQWRCVKSGVPQGSLPGFLLFSPFINDVNKIVSFSNHHLNLYTDDLQVDAYTSIELTNTQLVRTKLPHCKSLKDPVHPYRFSSPRFYYPRPNALVQRFIKPVIDFWDVVYNNHRECPKRSNSFLVIAPKTLSTYRICLLPVPVFSYQSEHHPVNGRSNTHIKSLIPLSITNFCSDSFTMKKKKPTHEEPLQIALSTGDRRRTSGTIGTPKVLQVPDLQRRRSKSSLGGVEGEHRKGRFIMGGNEPMSGNVPFLCYNHFKPGVSLVHFRFLCACVGMQPGRQYITSDNRLKAHDVYPASSPVHAPSKDSLLSPLYVSGIAEQPVRASSCSYVRPRANVTRPSEAKTNARARAFSRDDPITPAAGAPFIYTTTFFCLPRNISVIQCLGQPGTTGEPAAFSCLFAVILKSGNKDTREHICNTGVWEESICVCARDARTTKPHPSQTPRCILECLINLPSNCVRYVPCFHITLGVFMKSRPHVPFHTISTQGGIVLPKTVHDKCRLHSPVYIRASDVSSLAAAPEEPVLLTTWQYVTRHWYSSQVCYWIRVV